MALARPYNLFLVGRIWSEAERLALNDAIIAADTGASHAITAAGLVLSASFGALALVPVAAFQQLAFVLATGLLIDAFLVRTVLTPRRHRPRRRTLKLARRPTRRADRARLPQPSA